MSGFTVRFVLVDKSNQESIQHAVKAVQTAGLATEKVSEAKVFEIAKKDSCIYVCDPFEGKAFKHLLNSGCRIIGPQCVLSCLQDDVAIPKANHPIYNICLRGVEISCSSIEKHERERLHTLVQWMGGKVSRSFTETVTHLIAGEVGSKKYFVAADLKKPIMLPEWIHACWELSQGKHFVGTATEVIQEYSCPVFKGCNICVTGLDSEERNHIKRLASEHGGRYTGELKFKECTHLIANLPKGQKYEFAKKWKIPCVTLKWFYDSIEKASCQNEELHNADGSGGTQQDKVKSSTPKGGDGANKRPPRISSIADYSAIGGNLSMMSTVNETAMTTMGGNATINGTTLISTTFEERALQQQGKPDKMDNFEELDDLNVSDFDGNLFLDGCKILLSGFSGSRLEKLRKMINAGGGTRFNQLNASVSHVIIGDKVKEHHDLLSQGKFRPKVVSAQWLLDGLKQGAQVNEADYSVLDIPDVLHTMSPQAKPRNISNNTTKDDDRTMLEGDDDVMAMYMDNNKQAGDETTTDSEIMFNPKPEQDEEHNDNDETRVDQDEDVDRTACLEQEDVGIFSRKTFIIVGFPPDLESQIEEMITCQQGIIQNSGSRSVADYAVVPILGCQVESTVNEITTNCWLQMCIEMEQCLEPSSNSIFNPIFLVQDALPLQGCVVSISQYAGVERDCLLHIAELLGAICQEYFVRKPSGKLKANTHLLLKESEGSKYTAAKKWKIPAVTKEWLIKCANTGKRQPEDLFSVDRPPQSSTSSSSSIASATKTDERDQPIEFKQPELPSNSKTLGKTSQRTSVSTRETKLNLNQIDEAGSSSAKNTDPSLSESRNTASSSSSSTSSSSVTHESKRNQKLATSEPLRRISPEVKEVQVDNDVNVNSPAPSSLSNPKLQRIVGAAQKENFQTPKTAARTKANNKFIADLKAGVGMDTPSKFLGDNCNFRPSFDLDDVNAFLESPGTDHLHRRSRKSSMGLDDLLTANLAKAIANTADAIDLDQQESQSQDDSVFQENQPPGILDGVVLCVSKKLSKSQGDYNNRAAFLGAEYKWLYDESCTHFIFQGRANDMSKEFRLAKEQGKRIVSPHWLFACEEQQCHMDESQFPHTYNPKLVLPVVSTKTPARATPARGAKNTPAKATPARSTRQSARKVPTRQTRNSVKIAEVSPPPQPEIANDGFDKDSTDSDDEMMRVTEAAEGKALATNPPDHTATTVTDQPGNALAHDEEGSLEMRENFQKQFEEIMTSTLSDKSGKRRSRRQGSTTTSMSATNDDSTNSGRRSRTKRVTLAGTEEEQENGQKLGRPIESSQSVQITWDDPTSRKEREKIMAQLDEAGTQRTAQEQTTEDKQHTPRKTVRLDDEITIANEPEGDMEDSPPTPTPMAPPIRLPVSKAAVTPQQQPEMEHKQTEPRQRKPPKILLSGMSNEEKVDYGALIERLHGEVKDAQYFDPSCTHIVVGNPTRNEKYLASLASGKWVLHKSYLEACREQGVFVNEEDHEWGSATDLNSITPQTAKLALAAHRWRCKLDEEREKSNNQIIPGAFDGWRVLLLVERTREPGFKRLLQAGGAKILGMRTPFTNFEDATHGFFDLAKVKSSGAPVDLESIVSAGIQCLKPEYIAQFLMEDPLPDPVNYVISEVKPIIQRLGQSYSDTSEVSTPSKRKRESSMGLSRSKKSKR